MNIPAFLHWVAWHFVYGFVTTLLCIVIVTVLTVTVSLLYEAMVSLERRDASYKRLVKWAVLRPAFGCLMYACLPIASCAMIWALSDPFEFVHDSSALDDMHQARRLYDCGFGDNNLISKSAYLTVETRALETNSPSYWLCAIAILFSISLVSTVLGEERGPSFLLEVIGWAIVSFILAIPYFVISAWALGS